jgi:putative hemolysin
MADTPCTPGDPFALQFAHATWLTRAAFAAARPFLSTGLRLRTFGRMYQLVSGPDGHSFESRVLRGFEIRYRIHTGPRSIPATGPLIIAANHPTGIRDGLVLLEAIRQIRPDVRILTNHLLSRIPELAASCFFVDPFNGATAKTRSRAGLRAAYRWLRDGGALIIFPAGEVAHRSALVASAVRRKKSDSHWNSTMVRLALATNATVLPAYLTGENSRLFYAAGRIHPLLRTLLLGREFLNKRGTTAHISFGEPLSPDALRAAGTPRVITNMVREAVESLSASTASASTLAPIAAAVDPALLEHDVRALPGEAKLLTSGAYDVFCAEAALLPHVLPEIGRLREATFRAVGEGTGHSIDLDRFDRHYQHLFVWHRVRRQLIGAYRVGATDRIVAEHGFSGLYTTTLFLYDERLLERIGPALELGRSFVRADYQRSYNALLLLWKGLGRLIARTPHYRVLFGPVSISSRYGDTSQQFVRAFLAQQHGDSTLAALVTAFNPPPPIDPPARGSTRPADIGALDALVKQLEGTRGMPVLLRQYLRLNATLLGFNVDPAFGDALDALMMVDIARLPVATLRRYLGFEDAAALLARHRSPDPRSSLAA